MFNFGGLTASTAPGTNYFDQTTNAQNRQKLAVDDTNTKLAQNQATRAAAQATVSKANQITVGGSFGGQSPTYTPPASSSAPSYQAPSYQSPQNSAPSYTPPTYSNLQTNPPNSTIDAGVPQNFNNLNTTFKPPSDSGVNSSNSSSNYSPNAAVGQSSSPSLNTSFGNDNGSLTDVFTKLADLNNTQANQNQVRFNQDLNTQSQVYQDFDNVAAERTSKINTAARQQGYDLSSKLSAQGSSQNIAEAKNQGEVQANTTNSIRNSDMQRALSILPMRK